MNHSAASAELRDAMLRLEPEPEHTEHVARLALELFDQLSPMHGLGPDERILLEGAALLHDIGWPVSKGGSGHHKHSARLILRQSWKHLEPAQVQMMALVARYHRKALPCSEHGEFHVLAPVRQRVVQILAALLRLADAFDRSHLQRVRAIRSRLNGEHLEFTLLAPEPPAREIAGAEKKGNLAREVFGRSLAFRFERSG